MFGSLVERWRWYHFYFVLALFAAVSLQPETLLKVLAATTRARRARHSR